MLRFWKFMFLGGLLLSILIIPVNTAQAANSGLADSPWPMFHGDSKLSGQSKYDTSKNSGAIKWKFKAEDQIETSPVIGEDGTIYFGDQNCNFYAVSPQGKEKWKVKLGEAVTSTEWGYHSCFQASPGIAKDGTIYAFPMSNNFYALNPDGTEKWKYPIFTFKNDWSSPSIAADGTIYIGTELYPPHETGKPEEKTASVYAFNPDGTVKWSYDTKGVWVTSTSSIADDGTMYTSANDCAENNCKNTIFAFSPGGEIKWKYPINDGVNEGSVAVGADGTVYFDAKGERNPRVNAFFYALSPDGTEKWKYPLDEGVSMTPGISKDGKIYFGDWSGVFYALDLNGKLLWKDQTPGAYEALSSSPAIGKEGTIYFGTIAKFFYAYNPDGTKKWEISIADGGVNSSPAIGKDGTVYFATIPGELYAVGSGSQSASLTTVSNTNSGGLLVIILALAGIVLAVLGLVIKIKRKNNKIVILIVLGFMILAAAGYIFLTQRNIFSNDSGNYSCPSNIYLKGKDKYYVANGDEKRDLSNQETNWIKKNCSQLKWPDENSKSETNNASPVQEPKNNSSTCPHHVYGTTETGWYGAFDMQTKDLTNKEVEEIRKNCPNATFQAEVK